LQASSSLWQVPSVASYRHCSKSLGAPKHGGMQDPVCAQLTSARCCVFVTVEKRLWQYTKHWLSSLVGPFAMRLPQTVSMQAWRSRHLDAGALQSSNSVWQVLSRHDLQSGHTVPLLLALLVLDELLLVLEELLLALDELLLAAPPPPVAWPPVPPPPFAVELELPPLPPAPPEPQPPALQDAATSRPRGRTKAAERSGAAGMAAWCHRRRRGGECLMSRHRHRGGAERWRRNRARGVYAAPRRPDLTNTGRRRAGRRLGPVRERRTMGMATAKQRDRGVGIDTHIVHAEPGARGSASTLLLAAGRHAERTFRVLSCRDREAASCPFRFDLLIAVDGAASEDEGPANAEAAAPLGGDEGGGCARWGTFVGVAFAFGLVAIAGFWAQCGRTSPAAAQAPPAAAGSSASAFVDAPAADPPTVSPAAPATVASVASRSRYTGSTGIVGGGFGCGTLDFSGTTARR